MSLAKRILVTLALLATPFILGLLLTYQVIRVDWVSFMEIQPSYRPMEAPRPLPAGAVPRDGAAWAAGQGDPQNPAPPGEVSLRRGQAFYAVDCALCHGAAGQGDGPLAERLRRKPANLAGPNVAAASDGTLFLIVSQGVPGTMPGLRENLAIGDRWDVVNYVRSLAAQAQP